MSYPPPGPENPYGQNPQGQPYGQQPGQPPYGGYGGYGTPVPPSPPTAGKATTSLIMGIVSLFCLGLLLGIPAIFVGFSARKEIKASQGQLGGDGLAIGGIITGIIGTLWSIVVIGFFVVALAFGNSVQNTIEDNCKQLQKDDPAFASIEC